jgi:MFS-type transporter involved in bile tolerance (Atg22 family)
VECESHGVAWACLQADRFIVMLDVVLTYIWQSFHGDYFLLVRCVVMSDEHDLSACRAVLWLCAVVWSC